MAAPYSFGFIGNGLTRCVVLALPSSKVRALLPAGLELGDQSVTPRGMHPVIFQCHRFSECQFSFPNFLRSMNFHEQTTGIPFTFIREGSAATRQRGPYYFMPKLYLNDLWVLLNGTYWWGFNKEMAIVDSSDSRYTVTSQTGQRLASVEWTAKEDSQPAATGYEGFAPFRHMLSQTLISACPAGIGPFFSLTDFDRRWSLATVRPLESVLEVSPSHMPSFDGGRFHGDSRIVGSFELSGPWWLSLPYRTTLSPARDSAAARTWYI